MKKKNRRILKFILIAIALVVVYIFVVSITEGRKNVKKDSMLYDAKMMLMNADIEVEMNMLDENNKTTCLYVYGYEGIYENSGNYVGSIDLTRDKPYIVLSDGNYFVRGTKDDLTIIDSNLVASTTCNR